MRLERVVLLGAGWSIPFGGYTTRDLTDRVRAKLWGTPLAGSLDVMVITGSDVSSYTYEDLLGVLQSSGDVANQELLLDSIESVLKSMDDEMRGYRSLPWSKARMSGYYTFLCGLGNGVVFTLNHDLWFERFVCNGAPERLNIVGQEHPGHSVLPTVAWDGVQPWDYDELVPSVQHCTLDSQALNIVKLHGSLNWQDSSGSVLVMGANKSAAIEANEVLRCLDNLKDQYLVPAKKIMVYGYSFGDVHINEALIKASKQGTEFYVFDVVPFPAFMARLQIALPDTLFSQTVPRLKSYSSLGEQVFRKTPRYDLNNPGVLDQRLYDFLPKKFSVGSMAPSV